MKTTRITGVLLRALCAACALCGGATARGGAEERLDAIRQGEDGGSACVVVEAALPWQASGVTVDPSQLVCLSADGLWSHGAQGIQAMTPFYGPEGYAKDDPVDIPEVVSRTGALVARIGSNAPFVIGRQLCFIPAGTGELMLSMNDFPGTFENNIGRVSVRVARSPATQIPPRVDAHPRACRPRPP